MDAISLKLDNHLLADIDRNLQPHNYSTRTEFIRSAIREKLEQLQQRQLAIEFLQFQGKSSKKTTEKQNDATAKKVLSDMAKSYGWNSK